MIGLAPLMFWPGLLIALGLLFAFAWILVRHIGLAAAVALSPLPGFLLGFFGADPLLSFLGCLRGFIAAGFLAGAVAPLAANIAAGMAVRQSLGDLWLV